MTHMGGSIWSRCLDIDKENRSFLGYYQNARVPKLLTKLSRQTPKTYQIFPFELITMAKLSLGVSGWVYPNFQNKRAYLRCQKKQHIRPQFSKYRFQNESLEAADSFWNRNFENCGCICIFLHLLFLLTDRTLPHSPNFGRPKQGPKIFLHFFLGILSA